MKCLSDEGAFKYSFLISSAITYTSYKAVVVSSIYMLSRETTPAQLEFSGSRVWWSYLAHIAFLMKSIFTSNIRCLVDFVYPGGRDSPSSKISKATKTWYISFAIASFHSVSPFLACNCLACSIDLGTSIPNL